jgi:hypothetical protein
VFFDAVDQRTLRHLGTLEMTTALRGAVKRPLGDAWAWSRKSSSVDICPLVAATLAVGQLGSTVVGDFVMSFSDDDLAAAAR